MKMAAVAVGALVALSGCVMMRDHDEGGEHRMAMHHGHQQVTLAGANEVPAVSTSASGSGYVNVNPDHTVAAKIVVVGMTPTAAHIHMAAAGANGPVIVPFTKQGDDTFVAPPGAKLTDEQYEALKAGRLYVNVHSAKSPGGEIRAQLKGW
ncbi:MAG: CHRD domain-containing protein [Usitatibacter sp.]